MNLLRERVVRACWHRLDCLGLCGGHGPWIIVACLLCRLLRWRTEDVVTLLATIGVVIVHEGGLLWLNGWLLLQEWLCIHLVVAGRVGWEARRLLSEATVAVLVSCWLRVLVVEEAG